MEVGLVRKIDIDSEMQQAYLDYAMSVIVARALPDARDGLKPVHRRILYAMHLMGIRPNSPFKKSARIVGEVLGKFHPHGDMAVYDSMARMAQLFSMRYPLIKGQGNFGSIDGDPPAAMRYTEARLSPLSLEVLAEINKDTVDFETNFDGSLREPTVLPAALPNLLVNGATGIAVGMSTSIPPHNMTEICDALIFLLKEWKHYDKVSLDSITKIIQGPDFPTGGIILKGDREDEGLSNAYGTGRGKITVRAKAHFEEMGRGRSRIIVTELPYQTNKSNLIERIADLVREGKVEGITDLRDESDRQGMRIVIELAKTANEEKVLGELFRRTPMQSTFSIIMLALVDSQPRLLNLKQALKVYLDHRLEVVRRRSEYELARAKERAHVLEGLKIALDNLDKVIELIRKSRDVEQARKKLERTFKLSEVQAMAVLELPLRKLSTLERKAVDTEYKEVQKNIKALETLLGSERKMLTLISAELVQIKKDYGDRRKTMIVESVANGKTAAPVTTQAPSKDTWVVITKKGLISRTPSGRVPRLSGRAAPVLVIGAQTQDNLYLFDSKGMAVALAVHTLPEEEDSSQGHPMGSATPFEPGTKIVSGLAVARQKPGAKKTAGYILLATTAGMVKKSEVAAFPGPSSRPFKAINTGKGDLLGWTAHTDGSNEITLLTREGMGIRFAEDSVRPMGLSASGVKGIKLSQDDIVVSLSILQPKDELFVLASDGSAKRIPFGKFPAQGRHGKGVIVYKVGSHANLIGGFSGESAARASIHLKKRAARSIKLSDAPRRERASSGKALFELAESDSVVALSPVVIRPAPTKTGATKTVKKSKTTTRKRTSTRATTSRKKSAAKTTAKPVRRSKKKTTSTTDK